MVQHLQLHVSQVTHRQKLPGGNGNVQFLEALHQTLLAHSAAGAAGVEQSNFDAGKISWSGGQKVEVQGLYFSALIFLEARLEQLEALGVLFAGVDCALDVVHSGILSELDGLVAWSGTAVDDIGALAPQVAEKEVGGESAGLALDDIGVALHKVWVCFEVGRVGRIIHFVEVGNVLIWLGGEGQGDGRSDVNESLDTLEDVERVQPLSNHLGIVFEQSAQLAADLLAFLIFGVEEVEHERDEEVGVLNMVVGVGEDVGDEGGELGVVGEGFGEEGVGLANEGGVVGAGEDDGLETPPGVDCLRQEAANLRILIHIIWDSGDHLLWVLLEMIPRKILVPPKLS